MSAKFVFQFWSVTMTIVACAQTKDHLNLQFYNYTCLIVSKPIQNFHCDFNKIAPSHFVFNEHIMFDQDMGRDLLAKVRLEGTFKHSVRKLIFGDIKVAVCDAFSTKLNKILFKTLFGELRRTSNLPLKCPLKGNMKYFFNNYTITENTVPFYSPALNFTFSVDLYKLSKLIGTTTIMGSVEPK